MCRQQIIAHSLRSFVSSARRRVCVKSSARKGREARTGQVAHLWPSTTLFGMSPSSSFSGRTTSPKLPWVAVAVVAAAAAALVRRRLLLLLVDFWRCPDGGGIGRDHLVRLLLLIPMLRPGSGGGGGDLPKEIEMEFVELLPIKAEAGSAHCQQIIGSEPRGHHHHTRVVYVGLSNFISEVSFYLRVPELHTGTPLKH